MIQFPDLSVLHDRGALDAGPSRATAEFDEWARCLRLDASLG